MKRQSAAIYATPRRPGATRRRRPGGRAKGDPHAGGEPPRREPVEGQLVEPGGVLVELEERVHPGEEREQHRHQRHEVKPRLGQPPSQKPADGGADEREQRDEEQPGNLRQALLPKVSVSNSSTSMIK